MPADDSFSQRVVVPEHVVYRDFAAETVVLNLQTGQYHGLNPVAGNMLQTAEASPSVGHAVEAISAQYGEPVERIRTDLTTLLNTLAERGIVSVEAVATA